LATGTTQSETKAVGRIMIIPVLNQRVWRITQNSKV